jgi:hypothetical protein
LASRIKQLFVTTAISPTQQPAVSTIRRHPTSSSHSAVSQAHPANDDIFTGKRPQSYGMHPLIKIIADERIMS